MKLYGWLFTYNEFDETWSAYHKEDHIAYWNGNKDTVHKVYSNKSVTLLLAEVKKDNQL